MNIPADFDPLKPWWKSVPEVHLLLRWLAESGRIHTLTEAVDMTEKPVKWNPEREEMLREEAMERLHDEACFEEDLRRRGAA